MDIRIKLYLTTRTDPIKDLDEVTDLPDLKKWKADVTPQAVRIIDLGQLDNELIDNLQGYTVQECYAVITHHPERYEEAVHIGKLIKDFLRKHEKDIQWGLQETGLSAVSMTKLAEENPRLDKKQIWENFSYGIVADKDLKIDDYEVALEAVVKR
jgi:hypothetical protein